MSPLNLGCHDVQRNFKACWGPHPYTLVHKTRVPTGAYGATRTCKTGGKCAAASFSDALKRLSKQITKN